MNRLDRVLDRPEAAPVRERIESEGYSVDELRRIYGALDPTGS
jgi:hypothetical protein